jgi:hypothetical protein
LRGYAAAPIRDVRFADCRIGTAAKDSVFEQVEGLRMENVLVNGKALRPAAER